MIDGPDDRSSIKTYLTDWWHYVYEVMRICDHEYTQKMAKNATNVSDICPYGHFVQSPPPPPPASPGIALVHALVAV